MRKTSNKQERNEKGQLLPGSTANPNGRPPKGYSITEMMREMLANKPEVKEAIGAMIAAKAMEGDQVAIKTLWQYMDGMPSQGLELSGPNGGVIDTNLSITFVKPDAAD
jgi:hypothetical protein